MNELITVLTTVYNRKKEMTHLFGSLCNQTVKNFCWLIVDDGSSDGLKPAVDVMKEQADFPIEYVYKENGGKHTALNVGFEMIETELTFIVDSDDLLVDDAMEEITKQWELVRNQRISGISFLCGHRDGQVIGDKFPDNGIYNSIDIRFKYKVWGDKAEIWKTEVLKKYRFPEFEGEKFVSENYIWRQIAMEYDMMYVNKIIYLAEYLEGGLSRQGKKLIISSPLGAMEASKVSFSKKYPLKERIKRAWTYICYGKFAGLSFKQIIERGNNKLLIIPNYPFGLALYCYWKHLYRIKGDERNKNA